PPATSGRARLQSCALHYPKVVAKATSVYRAGGGRETTALTGINIRRDPGGSMNLAGGGSAGPGEQRGFVKPQGENMSLLSQEQIDRLSELMDERYERELEEINAIAARTKDERRQQALSSRSADSVDTVLAQMVRASDYAVVQQDIQDVRDIIA